MVDEHNVLAKAFRMVRDMFNTNKNINIKLRLIARRAFDARTYNTPEVDEIAALIVGDVGDTIANRDIIIETQRGSLQRISEIHPAYLALQYLLLFSYGVLHLLKKP